MEDKNKQEHKKKKKKSGIRLFLKILLGIFIFVFLVLLFIRSPWGQSIIVDELVSYIKSKTKTEVSVEKLYISFGGDLNVEGLYLEDKTGDTLLYSKSLEADIPLIPLIKGRGFSVDNLQWRGVRANITRRDSLEGFNFSFLTEAFAAANTSSANKPADTSSGSMKIILGDLELHDIEVDYSDQVLGIQTRIDLGSLRAEVQEFGLDSLKFALGDVLLEQTRFNYIQTRPFPTNPDTTASGPASFLSVENLDLNHVQGVYKSVPDGILADVDVGKLHLEMPVMDMATQEILVNQLQIDDSEVAFKMKSQASPQAATSGVTQGFEWPAWKVQAEEISVADTDFRYVLNDAELDSDSFNPEAFSLEHIFLKAGNLLLRDQLLRGEISRISFEENSGLHLEESSLDFLISEERLLVENMSLQLNENYLEGDLALNYESLDKFLTNPEETSVKIQLPEFHLDLSELYAFEPELEENQYFAALADKALNGSLYAEGSLSSVKIEKADVSWGTSTSLAAEGSIFNLMDPANIAVDIPQLNFSSGGPDIKSFLSDLDLGFEIPEKIAVKGSVEGGMEDLAVDAVLRSSAGDIDIDGRFSTAPQLAFKADIEATEVELGRLLNMPQLGPVTLEIHGAGGGSSLEEMNAEVKGMLQRFVYNDYIYKNLALVGEMEEGKGFIELEYKDDNLNLEAASYVELDSVAPNFAVQLDLIGADLQALGFTKKAIRAGLDFEAVFEGSPREFDAVANMTNAVLVYDEDSYLVGDMDVLTHVRPDTTSLDIDNRMLNLRLSSNAGPTELLGALNRHYRSYFSELPEGDSLPASVNLELRAEVSPSPVLEEVFLPSLEELDTIDVRVDFNEKEKVLDALVSLPHINYMGSEIDSLELAVHTTPEDLQFDLGLQSLNVGPLAIRETILEGRLDGEELLLDFASYYEDEILMQIRSAVTREEGVLGIHLEPDSLILNSKPWKIRPENKILIGEDFWRFEDFVLSRENQLLRAAHDLAEVEGEHIGVEFKNFNLAAITSYLNPEEAIVRGGVNGNLIIEDPFQKSGLLADLRINDFGILGVVFGNLQLDAEAIGGNSYNFDLAVNEGPADLVLEGSYVTDQQGANLDLQLDLIEVQMEVLEEFSQGEILETEGSFSGEFSLTGTLAEPVYEGSLYFDNAAFTVAMLDTPFLLPDETLRITNEGIFMDEFQILDVNQNELVLDGAVLTPSFINPEFDLSFVAEDFMAFNSTAADNELFYGRGIFDAEGAISGDLELPKIAGDIVVDEDTDMTYAIPEAQLEVEAREGIVEFVNRENPREILTMADDQGETVSFSGFALNSYISLEENATFTLILDQETGDHFKASGEGDLLFDVYPSGRNTLSGRVEIKDGYYEMGLYDLVTRRFDLVEGSSIVWAGDPLDADLNITATYSVETSAAALMASQITGAAMDVKQRFRQELTFLVYLYITGEINEPEIAFGLDMLEEDQGAVGGQVYGRVQQINQQDPELNKQVFSLLVLNRFFPDGTSDGSGGGTLGFARDNLNDALSDQLNIFSDRLLGETGVDLNFGLDTFTDYQGETPEERTQLDISAEKSFLNDRLIVSVGSEVDLQGSSQIGEGTSLIGNVSLEYLLTPDGQFRLEAFRRKSYENVIDGQLIISGLALIMTQEFNKFSELWQEIFAKEEEQPAETPVEPEKTSL